IIGAEKMVIYPRHVNSCKAKHRHQRRCRCPIWIDGIDPITGKRYHRSLKTSDWSRARQELMDIDAGRTTLAKDLKAAIETWRASLNIEESTWRNYRQATNSLTEFCDRQEIRNLCAISAETLDLWRSSRKAAGLADISCNRELSVLRI